MLKIRKMWWKECNLLEAWCIIRIFTSRNGRKKPFRHSHAIPRGLILELQILQCHTWTSVSALICIQISTIVHICVMILTFIHLKRLQCFNSVLFYGLSNKKFFRRWLFYKRPHFVVYIYDYWLFSAQLKIDSKEIITKCILICTLQCMVLLNFYYYLNNTRSFTDL